MSPSTLQSLKSASVILHSHPQSGAEFRRLLVQLTGSISSLHMAGVAQGHVGVLGWVCNPQVLELLHYTDAPFW